MDMDLDQDQNLVFAFDLVAGQRGCSKNGAR